MATPIPDFDRLLTQLQQTGLQQSNAALFQLISQLIKNVRSGFNNVVSGATPIPGGTTVVTQQILMLGDSDGSGGGDSESGPPGPAGSSGATGPAGPMVPYFISSVETFDVPEFKQALFAEMIDNEGMITLEGHLIEVD